METIRSAVRMMTAALMPLQANWFQVLKPLFTNCAGGHVAAPGGQSVNQASGVCVVYGWVGSLGGWRSCTGSGG